MKGKVIGQRSRSPVFSLVSEKIGQGGRSKVVVQGHRVKVKVVWGDLYPIDSREVCHAGVFIPYKTVFFVLLVLTYPISLI